MASLQVGDFKFGFASFHLNELTFEPETDQTGIDIECTKVTLDLHGVVNAVAIAANKAQEGIPGSVGNALPDTVIGLRDYLVIPRKVIIFEIAGVTIFESHEDGMESDVRGGPFPARASFSQVVGDKTALLQFRVVTYLTYCNKYLLSNRWTQRSTVGSDGMTTRTTVGRAAFRKDFLDFEGLQADDFRKWLIIPCPNDMRRVYVDVQQESDGAAVTYNVTEQEVNYGTGADRGILKVSGTATGGCESEIKTGNQMINKMASMAMNVLTLSPKALIADFNSFIPNSKFAAIARVDGRKGVKQDMLARVAVDVCLDRLANVYNPQNGLGFVSKLFVTNSHGSEEAPWSQCQIEVYGISLNILLNTVQFTPDNLINASLSIKINSLDGGPLFNKNIEAARLPNSDNTRGSQLTALISQVLNSGALPCALPGNPPADSAAQDTGGIY